MILLIGMILLGIGLFCMTMEGTIILYDVELPLWFKMPIMFFISFIGFAISIGVPLAIYNKWG